MPASRTSRRNPERRHRGLTCSNCRSRKTRCDGAQPSCKTCDLYSDVCVYDKMPPMSQVVAMATRLQEAEAELSQLRQALETRKSPSRENSLPTETDAGHQTPYSNPSPTQLLSTEERQSDLSIDEKGQICYYGPTSNLHEPPSLQPDASLTNGNAMTQVPGSEVGGLVSNAHESRVWEGFALGNAALQTDIPQSVLAQLLQIHWTWIAPNFMWVYRPAFMRDMMTGGQYYSPFLVTVMCAHAARFGGGEMKDLLMSRARLLLGTEIHKTSSIPTVQALLQLSARDLAFGAISQAWLYSGLAFRMVSDLGLHHSKAKMMALGHLSAEDLEIRRRLFWSCYFWDKAISLYLGRMPALSDLPSDHSPELLEDYTETELWSPHHGESLNMSKVSVGEYPPSKTHAISCFQNSCRLAVILNDIILRLYSRNAVDNADRTLRDIRKRLDAWREQTPAHLKLDPLDLPETCPPPHIVTQNMLYYATIILLHRPFYSTSAHHLQCRNASHCLEKLTLTLEKTFGVTRITYIIAYCIYTGASVIVPDVKAGDLEASTKMQTFLRALRGGVSTCPLLQRSIDITTNSLNPGRDDLRTPGASIGPTEDLASGRYLPAFPLPGTSPTFDNEPSLGALDFDAFTVLDCFPEYHTTSAEANWYLGTGSQC